VARLIFFTIYEIANDTDAPTWTDTSFLNP
jgi:hypothetical protein